MQSKNKLFYGWWVVIGITFMSFATTANPFSIILKQLMTEFNSGRGMISLATSISIVAGGITGLFLGKLLLNHSPKIFILCGSIICGICFLLMSLSQNLWQYYTLSFIWGASGAGAGAIPMFTLLSRWFSKKWGTAIGITMTGSAIGMMAMAPLIGLIAQNSGWRATYVFAGALVLVINIPITLLLIKDSPEKMGLARDGASPAQITENTPATGSEKSASVSAKHGFGSYLKKPALWLVGFTFTLVAIGDVAVTQHQVSFLTDMGISATMAASALGFTMGISGIGKLASGWIADRFSSRYVTMAFIIIEFSGIFILMNAHNMSMVWLFVIVYGIATGAAGTLLPCVLTDIFGTAGFSVLFSVIDIFYKAGYTIGGPLAGFIFDATKSYSLVFVLITVFYFLAMLTIYFAFGSGPGFLHRKTQSFESTNSQV